MNKSSNDNPIPGSEQIDVLNQAEAAAYLHQKPRTIRNWRARRGLPCFKPTAKVILYRRTDIDAWLECHRQHLRVKPGYRRRSEQDQMLLALNLLPASPPCPSVPDKK